MLLWKSSAALLGVASLLSVAVGAAAAPEEKRGGGRISVSGKRDLPPTSDGRNIQRQREAAKVSDEESVLTEDEEYWDRFLQAAAESVPTPAPTPEPSSRPSVADVCDVTVSPVLSVPSRPQNTGCISGFALTSFFVWACVHYKCI